MLSMGENCGGKLFCKNASMGKTMASKYSPGVKTKLTSDIYLTKEKSTYPGYTHKVA
jgi:hypothetical protein